MKPVQLKAVTTPTPADIKLQDASADIWDKKYRLKSKDGEHIDQTIDDTYQRVARALAEVEAPENRTTGMNSSSGPCATAPSRPAASPPMPAPWNTSRPPRPSTVPCPVLWKIP